MARRRGIIPNRLARKLTLIDHAFALVRHISEISVENFMQELGEALKGELGEKIKHGEKGEKGERGEKGGKGEKAERDQDGEEGVQGETDEKGESGEAESKGLSRARGVHFTSVWHGHAGRLEKVAQDEERADVETEKGNEGEETVNGGEGRERDRR